MRYKVPLSLKEQLETITEELDRVVQSEVDVPSRVLLIGASGTQRTLKAGWLVSLDYEKRDRVVEEITHTFERNSFRLVVTLLVRGGNWTWPKEIDKYFEQLLEEYERIVSWIMGVCEVVVTWLRAIFEPTGQSAVVVGLSTSNLPDDKFEVFVRSGVTTPPGEVNVAGWLASVIDKRLHSTVEITGDLAGVYCSKEQLEAVESSLFLSEL